jgi:hypothetical protein
VRARLTVLAVALILVGVPASAAATSVYVRTAIAGGGLAVN